MFCQRIGCTAHDQVTPLKQCEACEHHLHCKLHAEHDCGAKDDHECDEAGEIHEYDLCRSCKDHAAFCSVCSLSNCCSEPQLRAS
jgi:hypothetical protein